MKSQSRIIPIQIHIPKTGGLSVRHVLGAEKSMVCGHNTMKSKVVQAQMERGKHHLFTFVREPIERLVSSFYFFHDDNRKTKTARINKVGQKARYALLFHLASNIGGPLTAEQFWKKALSNNKKLLKHLTQFLPHFGLMVRWTAGREDEMTLYDFGDFDNECNRLRVNCGLTQLDLSKKTKVTHASSHGTVEEELSPETIAELKIWLAPDYVLYEKMLKQKAIRNATPLVEMPGAAESIDAAHLKNKKRRRDLIASRVLKRMNKDKKQGTV